MATEGFNTLILPFEYMIVAASARKCCERAKGLRRNWTMLALLWMPLGQGHRRSCYPQAPPVQMPECIWPPCVHFVSEACEAMKVTICVRHATVKCTSANNAKAPAQINPYGSRCPRPSCSSANPRLIHRRKCVRGT